MYRQVCLLIAAPALFAGCINNATAGAMGEICPVWSGYYLGAKAGVAYSRSETQTATYAGSLFTPIQASLVNRVGMQAIENTAFLAGVETGYNWQFSPRFLLGLSLDMQSLGTNGLTYSDAIPYNDTQQWVITSYMNTNWLLTARPRLGLISNHALWYVTGGLGLSYLQNDFLFTDTLGNLESKRSRGVRAGYVLGAGVETSLTSQVSLKAEYLFEQIGDKDASDMTQPIVGQPFLNQANLNTNLVTLGINYYPNGLLPNSLLSSTALDPNDWRSALGLRVFFSSGNAGAPQPLLNYSDTGDFLASRLIFSGLAATTGEVFGRLEHISGVFVKGYMGAGTISSGQLNDEDFPAGVAYSNTYSAASGNLAYATVDLGYNFLRNAFSNAGIFIGYNYFAQNINIYGCTQVAGSNICVPSTLLTNFMALSEDDQFNSLRVGFATEFNLTNRWSLASEAAYMPLVNFTGLDMHNARELVGPEKSNNGDGAMLEASLNYQINSFWSAGAGARYWTWNMHNGHLLFDFLGNSEVIIEPARFNANRYGVFLQASYHTPQPGELVKDAPEPVNWRGVVIGGTMGGAWNQSNWSDPFGATPASPGYFNVAGFGNTIHSSGPLGGGEVFFNWQTGRFVYGVGASLNAADIRGENTVFSGLGGINGQEITQYIGTLVGRLGATYDRSLFYVNAGRAALGTKRNLLGNTGVLSLGLGSQRLETWGWTGGLGVEYAFNPAWSSSIEYEYIRIPNHMLLFPTVDLVNEQSLSSHQDMSVCKLGLHYRFGVFA